MFHTCYSKGHGAKQLELNSSDTSNDLLKDTRKKQSNRDNAVARTVVLSCRYEVMMLLAGSFHSCTRFRYASDLKGALTCEPAGSLESNVDSLD